MNEMVKNANKKQAKAEGEMENREMAANALKYLLPELWKCILTLKNVHEEK